MVRQQLAFLRQTHGVDTMRLKHKDRDIGTDRDDHQGEEQIIPTRQLGDQENPVKGACITPDMIPAIPSKAKFFSEIYIVNGK